MLKCVPSNSVFSWVLSGPCFVSCRIVYILKRHNEMISVCLCLGMNSTWLKRSFRNYLSARRQERGAGYLLIFIYLFCKLPSCIWDRKNWCHGIFWKDLLWTWLETKHQSWDRNLQITRRRNQRLNLRQPWGIRRAMGLVRERCRCCCMNLLGHGIASYEVLCKRKGYTVGSILMSLWSIP